MVEPVTDVEALISWLDDVGHNHSSGSVYANAATALRTLQERVKRAEEALRPFAKFDMSGFDGIVLEVVPSDALNPAPRIEPILASYFRRAAAYFSDSEEIEVPFSRPSDDAAFEVLRRDWGIDT